MLWRASRNLDFELRVCYNFCGIISFIFEQKERLKMHEKHLILMVDDDPVNLKQAQMILEKQYRVVTATSGARALAFLQKNVPDLILLDIKMPVIDGFEMLERIRDIESCALTPVIFLTSDSSAATETKCLSAGATDFIGKPFVPQVLQKRVERTLEIEMHRKNLEELVSAKVEELTHLQEAVIVGIANLIESRDKYTGEHVKNTQNYVSLLTRELQRRELYPDVLDEEYAEHTIKAAVLHDVGKIKIPDSILTKPGRLTEEEFETIKLHTTYGDDIITDIIGDVEDKYYVRIARYIARSHHERWDGKGYPDGVAGEDIPLCARIMALADVFDALASERCYKKPILPIDRVFDILNENSGTQFDPNLTKIFLELKTPIINSTVNGTGIKI